MARSLGSLRSVELGRLSGVGPNKLAALAAFGIHDVLDLVTHYPRRYLDRTRELRIADLAAGGEVSVLARVRDVSSRRVRGGRVMVTGTVGDPSGALRISFFNQAWRQKQLRPGTEAVFHGRVEVFRGQLQMTNPVVDLVGDRTGRIVPVYPQSEKIRLTSWEIGDWVAEALRRAGPLEDPVPGEVLERYDLVPRDVALRSIHLPESMAGCAQARTRLVFDELLRVQLALVLRKRRIEHEALGVVHTDRRVFVDRFFASLPWPLTAAQRRCIDEILDDMRAPAPMHRLLQGDVGAGKTLVAVAAALAAVEGGHQAAVMAPTEVLSEQHAMGVAALLGEFEVGEEGALFARPVRVELLTGRVGAARRRQVTADLADGRVDVVVGTHALLSEDVRFASLGLVVIDEQHRFGVEQRAALRGKAGAGPDEARVPDVLVMTATPIPRTAAMTVYGDLDVSVLDELPPGRTPVATTWVSDEASLADTWADVRAELGAGRQAYVVCPLVDESEKLEVASAVETLAALEAGELAGFRCGLLHGRVAAEDKATVMDAFRSGELDVLVATTVIEVGVDVPNATVMVVLDADRFGMAQLHQLRGRVGRGAAASRCYLCAADVSTESAERLGALVESTDGFVLAEVDLDLRGEGTIMGVRQKGVNDLKLASLRRDRAWVERARAVAFDLVDGPPASRAPLLEELRVFLDEEDAAYLLKS